MPRLARIGMLVAMLTLSVGGVAMADTAGTATATPTPSPTADYAATVRGDSALVGYWRLGESAGTTAADERGLRPGTYVGGVELGRPGALTGQSDTATTFGGLGEYVQMPAGMNLGADFTLEAWVRPGVAGSGTGPIVMKNSGPSGYFLYTQLDRTVVFGTGRTDGYPVVVGPSLTPGRWHHVVATLSSGTTLTLYVDGAPVATKTVTAATPAPSSVAMRIGANTSDTSRVTYDGAIDEVSTYTRALSATDVSTRWAAAGSGAGNGPEVDPVPADPAVMFGFTDNSVIRGFATAVQVAELAAPLGTGSIRLDFNWRFTETTPGTVNWKQFDTIYTEYMARGIRPMWILNGVPQWALDGQTCAPAEHCWGPVNSNNYPELRRIAGQLAARYPRSFGIELGNEVNVSHDVNAPVTPEKYVEMLREVRSAVKAANPAMKVVGPALAAQQVTSAKAYSLNNFLTRMYKAGAKGLMDALSLHSYPCSGCEPFSLEWVKKPANQARYVRDLYGDSATPIWVDESGVTTTGSTGTTEARQGDRLSQVYTSLMGERDIRAVMLYTLIETGTGTSSIEPGYGIVRHGSLIKKPAYCELASTRGFPGACA